MIHEKIDELHQQMLAAWNDWRAVPENVPHPAPPNFDTLWQVIRLLRHVQRHGSGSLQTSQVKLVQRICGVPWWVKLAEAYPYKPQAREAQPASFKRYQHLREVTATPGTRKPVSTLTIQERKARLLRLKEEAVARGA